MDAEEPDKTTLTQRLFFHNPIDCAKYLVLQKVFAQDMVYALVTEWNSEERPQQVYSEMHTADRSWETQLSSDATFHSPSIPHIGMQIDN